MRGEPDHQHKDPVDWDSILAQADAGCLFTTAYLFLSALFIAALYALPFALRYLIRYYQ